MGTDCRPIDKNILENAFAQLNNFDIVTGPATDGGYYLLGMKKTHSFLFQNIKWSTDTVLKETLELIKEHKLSYFLLPALTDIDEEKDFMNFKSYFV